METNKYIINVDGRNFPLIIKQNARAKRCILRVDHIKNAINITIPKYTSYKKGIKFAESQIPWIKSQIAKIPEKRPFYDGMEITIAGQTKTIKRATLSQKGTKQSNNMIIFSGKEEHFNRRVIDFIKKEAKTTFNEIGLQMAKKLGTPVKKISAKDTTSRWGSCNSAKNISLSWRLMLAPYEVMEYVIAHEVAHLVELNHSEKFWKIVNTLTPNTTQAQKWLKNNGNSLHLYGK